MNNKGISHIEVILSFLLFITAVGFGLYFFNSSSNVRLAETIISYAFREIEKNTSINLEVYSVTINGSAIPSGEIALNFSGVGRNVTVITYEGERLNSSRGGQNGELVYISSSNWRDKEFIYVIFGEEFFEDSLLESEEHNKDYYRIGSYESREVISEKRLKILNQTYYKDYRGLKLSLIHI